MTNIREQEIQIKNLDVIQLILMPCGAQNDLRDIHAYRQHIHSVHSIYRSWIRTNKMWFLAENTVDDTKLLMT